MDETRLRRSIREALAHLYQPGYLHAHPLAALLIEARLIQTAGELATLLQSAIEQLRPAGGAPRNSPGWRQYRYLRLRYVECVPHRRVAEDLQISTRQACREHEAGLRSLASSLWHRYTLAIGRRSELGQPASVPAREARPRDGAAAAVGPTMEAELLRLGSEPPDSPTSLTEVLDGALATVSRLAAARGLAVRVELPPDVPPVVVNRLALRHVLLNLLGYLIEGARAGSMAISAEVGPEAIELGFVSSSEADRPPTERSDQSSGAHPGLVVARRLLEMQGGQLRLEAIGGDPTRAVLSLPITRATTVLLVDDSADIGRLFRRYLAGTGYYLVHARSAEKARRLVREVHPSVILLDVLLPGDDGWQFLEDLRADEALASVPVIACTVVPQGSLAISLGVEFLPKPVSRSALLAALARLCPAEETAAHRDRSAYTPPAPPPSGRLSD